MRVLKVFLAVMALMLLALPASAGDVCVSVDNRLLVDMGASDCNAQSASVAVAVNGSIAFSEAGTGNTSIAVNGSSAIASDGDDGLAVAANGSSAGTGGNDNFALAVNTSTAATNFPGDGNSIIAVNSSEDFSTNEFDQRRITIHGVLRP